MADDVRSVVSSVSRLQRYLAQDPGNERLRADLFDSALAAGERAVAEAQVVYALEREPASPSWRHRQAVLMLASKDYARAQLGLEALLAEGHDAPAIRHNLAYALFIQGQYEAARDCLASLLDRPEADAAVAWTLWLRIQHRLGRLDEALSRFRAKSAEVPLPPEAWGVASLVATDANRLDEARLWCERALRDRPDQLEALAARGTLALAAGDSAGALGCFGRGLESNPNDGRTWSGIAMAKMLAHDLPAADEAFGRALAGMPEHLGTWLGMGWCRFLLKRLDGAREAFEQALRIDRNFGESHGALAVVLLALGDEALGRREMEIALRLDRNGLAARYAQAMLSGEATDPAAMLELGRRLVTERRALLGTNR